MLAKRIPTILPPMSFEESLETTRIHSVAGLLPSESGLTAARPFRSPHHTISDAGLVGGGSIPRPGEVSMAHNGVLFLDELPEFPRNVLEVLRQPLEERRVTIARAQITLTFPASFVLIAAMSPPVWFCKRLPTRVLLYAAPESSATCRKFPVRSWIASISKWTFQRFRTRI